MNMTESNHTNVERRTEKRLKGIFPVRVRGITAAGQLFEMHTLADNISEGGLYLQLPYALQVGMSLFTLIRLPGGASLAARGRIVREEAKQMGLNGIAVCFSHRRLIPIISID
ncbi:MAG: PilZ domain-containing protein [Methylosarcina sp.]